MKSPKIKICPRCGSTDITSDPLTDTMGMGMQNFRCKKCDFSGTFFPEIDIIDVDHFKKDLKSKK
jgi:hypothetical protein